MISYSKCLQPRFIQETCRFLWFAPRTWHICFVRI